MVKKLDEYVTVKKGEKTMFDHIVQGIPAKTQGIAGIVVGILLLFGAFGSLGMLQAFFHTIMVAAGVLLLFWGLDKSELLKSKK